MLLDTELNPTEAIPSKLKSIPNWCRWEGTKRPLQADGKPASVSDSTTWATFETVEKFAPNIGFVITSTEGLACIDLDGVLEDGQLSDTAKEILKMFPSYSEISPSGKGLHIWVSTDHPFAGRRRSPIEVYSQGRFMTVTGNHLTLTPREIRPGGLNLTALLADLGETPEPFIGPYRPAVKATPNAFPPTDKFALLWQQKFFRDLWELKDPQRGQDISKIDWTIGLMAKRDNWTPQETADLIVAFRLQAAAQLDPVRRTKTLRKAVDEKYLNRTILSIFGAGGLAQHGL